MSRRRTKAGTYTYAPKGTHDSILTIAYEDGEIREYSLQFEETLTGKATRLWGSHSTEGPFSLSPYSARWTLVNMSTRATLANGPLISGFVVKGDLPRWVLLRGIGPGLAPLGVDNAASDTTIELFDSEGRALAGNDDWENEERTRDEVKNSASRSGAFPMAKRDACLLRQLRPGIYTTHVRAKSPGEVMLEVYLVP